MNKNTNFDNSINCIKPITPLECVKKIVADLFNIFEKMRDVSGMYDTTVEKHQQLCTTIPKQIDEGIIKIAVVGAIKSGKSTLINSLIMDDILKRGAGVVTSVITRVKRGDILKAEVIFKSWDDINHEIEKALTLIPLNSEGSKFSRSSSTQSLSSSATAVSSSAFTDSSSQSLFTRNGFDLRRKNDRRFLETVRSTLFLNQWREDGSEICGIGSSSIESEFHNRAENGKLRQEAVLISNALDGYENVKNFIPSDPSYIQNHLHSSDLSHILSSPVEFTGENFLQHKQFTGISSNAFFVKDVIIHIPYMDSGIEFADCQGSDSTDASHISQIQDYLLSANMLIYVISSRTGLREADVKFLTLIKQMGIINNIFFVLNFDFNEHDNLQSLLELEKHLKQEIAYCVDAPDIYTLSSLFNLFHRLKHKSQTNSNINNLLQHKLSKKELSMLKLWQQDKELVEYTTQKFKQFEQALEQKIEKERFSTVLENHIERLRVVIQGSRQRTNIFMNLLSNDLQKVSDAAQNLKQLQEQYKRFGSSLDGSISIAVQRIKNEIRSAAALFFDKKSGKQAVDVKSFILEASIYSEKYQEMIANFGFNHALYCMYQDFRSELDAFMAQQFNPAVVEFIHQQEDYIENEFQALYQSCYVEPSAIYPSVQSSVKSEQEDNSLIRRVDLNGAKRILGLTMPKSSFATAYSAKIRADAMARFTFYSFMEILAKFIRSLSAANSSSRALKESAKKIRQEAVRSVMLHFDEYSTYIKDEYLFLLVDAISRDSKEKLLEIFQISTVESKSIEQLISDECFDKSSQLERVKDIAADLNLLEV
ncbi:MAG: dynamin family protein [Desulfamplus sp.]|nr:dynamin family protein [Desulfamplus sp.]